MTGGAAAIFGGAAIVGAGSSMVMNPMVKKASGERMTGGDYVTDVVVGGVIGTATGGIGAGGSALTKGATGAVKLGVRVGAGAVSGITGGAISEVGRAVKGEEVNAETFGKSMAVGMVCGGIGGGSSHLASNISKAAGNEAAKVAVRVGTQTASGAAVDSAMQYAENGEVDWGQVAVRAAGQTVIAASAETARFAAERTTSYADKVTNQRIEEDFKDPKEAKEVKKMIDKANKIPQKDLKEMRKNMNEREQGKLKIDKYDKKLASLAKGTKTKQGNMRDEGSKMKQSGAPGADIKKTVAVNRGDIKAMKDKTAYVHGKNHVNKHNLPDSLKGPDNFHYLEGDRKGQAAMDLPAKNGNNNGFSRSGERILLERDADLNKKTYQKFNYAGKVENHDYSKAPKPNNLKALYDPHDAIKPTNFLHGHEETYEDEEEV